MIEPSVDVISMMPLRGVHAAETGVGAAPEASETGVGEVRATNRPNQIVITEMRRVYIVQTYRRACGEG